MKPIGTILSLFLIGLLGSCLSSCDQLSSAYLVNDTLDSVEVILSIINPAEVERLFVYEKLEGDTNAQIYQLDNHTTRIEFSLCSKCEFEIFFDTAPLKATSLKVDTLRIVKSSGVIQLNKKEDIWKEFVKVENSNRKNLIIED